MKQIDCTYAELAVARLVIAAMRSDQPVMVEYAGADNAVYVYDSGARGHAMTPLCLTHPSIQRIDAARAAIQTHPGGADHA